MPKARAARPFVMKGDGLAPEIRRGRLILRAAAEFRHKNIKGSLIAGLLLGAFLSIFAFLAVATTFSEVLPALGWVKWPAVAFVILWNGLHQAWLEAKRVGPEFWAFDRRRDAIVKEGREIAPLSDVRALRVKGAWRREGYRDNYKRLHHRAPRFVYYVEIDTEAHGRIELNHWSPDRIRQVAAALEAGLGVPVFWKGVLPGDALPPVPERLLAEA
jgi:hypothetical protein